MTENLPHAPVATRPAPLLNRRGRLLLVAGILVLAATLLLSGKLFTASFARIERSAMERQARQLRGAFAVEVHKLQISADSFARSDDSADYAATGNPRFLTAGISTERLTAMRTDLVWIIGGDGKTIYSGLLEHDGATLQSPVPAALLARFDAAIRATPGPARAGTGHLLRTARGLAAYATADISAINGPAQARLLFATFIGPDDVARLGETLNLDLRYRYLPNQFVDASALAVPQSIRRWTGSGAGDDLLIEAGDADITAYALVRDMDGVPSGLFYVREPRSIYRAGQRATWTLVGSIAALLLVSGAMAALLLRKIRRSSAARREATQLYGAIAAQLNEAILLVDAESFQVVTANPALRGAVGARGRRLRLLGARDIFPDLATEQLQAAARDAAARTVCASRMRSGTGFIDAEVSVSPIVANGQRMLCLVAHDVSHRRAAEEQQRNSRRRLAHLAQHDVLTGLPNRLYLRARLPRALRLTEESGKILALMVLDLDHFKNVNDTSGHETGDGLLRVVAHRLRATVSATDVVVRMGGDEFVIVASLLPDLATVEAMAARLQAAVHAPIALDGRTWTTAASIGIAVCPRDGNDVDTLLRNADLALYQAKAAGRGVHRLYSEDMQSRARETLAVEQSLREAIRGGELFLEYQPIVDLATSRVSSLEALMRWRHPDLGIIPPDRFIPVAEGSGLSVDIGMEALRQALAQLRKWEDANVPMVPVAINLSAPLVESAGFSEAVIEMARESGVEPSWLRFEITESVLLKDPEGLASRLRVLRSLGCQLLIDDFGTGYSGLQYLARLPVDALKLDKSFISEVGRTGTRATVVQSVIDMAHKLNMVVIAEGIETQKQVRALRDHGCGYGQGFYFSAPVGARQCEALLHSLGWERPITATLVARTLKETRSA
jgi:diguanylate cyclase (GGDEF)-like protein